MKKRTKIFFNPIDGYGPLFISYFSGQKGDAVESLKQNGVGYFLSNDELAGVMFDEVNAKNDQQKLEFSNGVRISIKVTNGKIEIVEVYDPHQKKAS